MALPWKVFSASRGRLTSNSKVNVPTSAIISSGRAMAGIPADGLIGDAGGELPAGPFGNMLRNLDEINI